MDALRVLALASLLLVALATGGAIGRLVALGGDGRAAASVGLLLALVGAAVIAGARGRSWRDTPYW